jgi:hypothetical protein
MEVRKEGEFKDSAKLGCKAMEVIQNSSVKQSDIASAPQPETPSSANNPHAAKAQSHTWTITIIFPAILPTYYYLALSHIYFTKCAEIPSIGAEQLNCV